MRMNNDKKDKPYLFHTANLSTENSDVDKVKGSGK